MTRWTRLATAGLAAWVLLPLAAGADTVYFKSGEKREGRVEEVPGNPGNIALISSIGRIEVPRSIIDRIEETSDAEDYVIVGDQFIAIQAFDRAAQMFQRAIDADPTHQPAREGLARARDMMAQQQVEAERERIARNSQDLTQVRTLTQEGSFEAAEALLEDIEAASPTDEQQQVIDIAKRDLYLAWGLSRLDRLDPYGAEVHLNKVIEMDPDNEEAQDALLQVWERDRSKRGNVIDTYQRRLAKNPNDLEMNRRLADLLLAENRFEEAVPVLETFRDTSVYRANEYGRLHRSALERVAQNYSDRGDIDAAIEWYQKLTEEFPDASRSPLAYLQYQKRLNELAADDWEGRAALLSYLEDNGMESLAAQEARLILRYDPENEKATALLRRMADADLKALQDLMIRNQWVLARSMALTFAENYSRFPDLIQAATDIHAEASLQAERMAKERRDQARDVVALGDEYLAAGRRNMELRKSDESTNNTILVYKAEARLALNRAIEAYRAALQIDPSLGPLVGGMDVNRKLAEAQRLRQRLDRDPIRIFNPARDSGD